MSDPRPDEPLVPLCRLGQYQRAALIRQTLEAEGIPVIAEGENFSALFGIGSEAPWSMRLLVRRGDRPRALEILREMESGDQVDALEDEP